MNHSTHGFTLTETTIVLGVVSLVLGAVWVAVGTVSKATQISQTAQQVGEVSQNIRSYYMNAQGIPLTGTTGGGGCDLTNTLPKEIFPTSVSNRAGGTFKVIAPAVCGAGIATSYRIVLSGLTRAACSSLLVSGMSYTDNTMGIAGICGGGSAGTCASVTSSSWNGVSCVAGNCGVTLAGEFCQDK